MTQRPFGETLREARERKGFSINETSRRLRIRPDILKAIEAGDFQAMPPRGYARNMVHAYARMVGLNPTEMTRRYLDEAYAYQVGRARRDQQVTGFDMGDDSRANRPQRGRASSSNRSRESSFGRDLYDDRIDSYESSRPRDYNAPLAMRPMQPRKSRNPILPTANYTSFVSSHANGVDLKARLPLIIAGIVILILIILLITTLVGGKKPEAEEVPNVPITGLTDTSGTPESQGAQPVQMPVAPERAVFEFSIEKDNEAWVEIYLDGSDTPTYAGVADGGTKETFDVTGTLEFVTANPAACEVSVDGQPLELTDEDGDGVYTCEVDFQKILEQWEADNAEVIEAAKAAREAEENASSQSTDATSNATQVTKPQN